MRSSLCIQVAVARINTRSEIDMDYLSTYQIPDQSRASHNVLRRSKASLRGALIAKLPAFDRPRLIQFESMLEYRFLCLMLIHPDIHDIIEQPDPIHYRRGGDGPVRKHIFDYVLTLKTGERIAVALKPARRVEKSGFKDELQHIAAVVSKTFAHRILLVTECHINRHSAEAAARRLMSDRPTLLEGQ